MPYSMLQALQARGCETMLYSPEGNWRRWHQRARSRMSKFVPPPLKDVLKRLLGLTPSTIAPAGTLDDHKLQCRTREEASRKSRETDEQVRGPDPDAFFGCCIGANLCELAVDVPIVYFSDTTARLIFDMYPQILAQPEGHRRACDEIERRALGRVSAAVFAMALVRESAIKDYGVPPERAFTVPMGANIASAQADSEPLLGDAPTRDRIRLVMTAADPLRKRLDLAIDAVDILRGRGWGAELELIGPLTPLAVGHPHVRCLGRLRLSTIAGRRSNAEAFRRSHLTILPSIGEAFGIAPFEAALVGKPSVVSAVGGLPEVVQH